MRDPALLLGDMADAARRVIRYAEGVGDDELLSDPMRRDAILYALVVVGEAAKQVPREARRLYPDVPWSGLAGLRDVMVHQYHGMRHGAIATIARVHLPRDLPSIDAALDEALQEWRLRHPDAVE